LNGILKYLYDIDVITEDNFKKFCEFQFEDGNRLENAIKNNFGSKGKKTIKNALKKINDKTDFINFIHDDDIEYDENWNDYDQSNVIVGNIELIHQENKIKELTRIFRENEEIYNQKHLEKSENQNVNIDNDDNDDDIDIDDI